MQAFTEKKKLEANNVKTTALNKKKKKTFYRVNTKYSIYNISVNANSQDCKRISPEIAIVINHHHLLRTHDPRN